MVRSNHVEPCKDHWFRESDPSLGVLKFPVFDEIDYRRYKAGIHCKTKIVKLTNKWTNKETIYLSTEHCAVQLNTSESTISRLCRGIANPLSETYLGEYIGRSIIEE